MNRLTFTKSISAAAVALVALTAGAGAHAGTDLTLIIGGQPSHRQVAPVFVQHHRGASVHPEAIYRAPHPLPFERERAHGGRRGGPDGDADRDGVPNRFDRDSRFYDPRAARRHVQWGDFDRDGVVNQFDRAPRNPHRY